MITDPSNSSSDRPLPWFGWTALTIIVLTVAGCEVGKHVTSQQTDAMKRCIEAGSNWSASTWNSGSCIRP